MAGSLAVGITGFASASPKFVVPGLAAVRANQGAPGTSPWPVVSGDTSVEIANGTQDMSALSTANLIDDVKETAYREVTVYVGSVTDTPVTCEVEAVIGAGELITLSSFTLNGDSPTFTDTYDLAPPAMSVGCQNATENESQLYFAALGRAN